MTYRECPLRRPTGETSAGSSASECRVKFSGTLQRKTLCFVKNCIGDFVVHPLPCHRLNQTPTDCRRKGSCYNMSPALTVCDISTHQSVSSTAAVCPRKSGNRSGSRPRSVTGMTANAPPPLASQLTEMYSGLAYL